MESILAELPDWARVLFYVFATAFAAGLFIYGKYQPQKASRSGEAPAFELKAAMVDSSAVQQLTAAIEAQNVEARLDRVDSEKSRKLGHELVEAIEALTKELSEIRNEMRFKRN